MRLVCPRCGAEYEIDDRLIPASGREVECSSCESAWFQPGRLRMPAPLAAAAPGAVEAGAAASEAGAAQAGAEAPRLGRSLPEDVMDILRDEAAHFRASHPGIEAALPVDAAPADPDAVPAGPGAGGAEAGSATADIAAEPEAAATAPEGDRREIPAPDPGGARMVQDARAEVLEVRAVPPSLPIMPPSPEPRPRPAGRDQDAVLRPTATQPAAAAVPVRRRGGFGKGFVIGLLIAGLLFGLYTAAPHAGEGMLGDALRAIRAAGDGFHHWVQAKLPR